MSESYPKKYWWLVLVAVPLIVALVQILPTLLDRGGGGEDSEGFYIAHADFGAEMYFTNVSVIVGEYESSTGQALEDPELKRLLQEAVNLAQGGDVDASIPLFEEAARQIQLPSIYNNLGVLYSRTENYEAAETAYEKVIRLDPDYASTHRNLGLLKESRGRLSEAGEHFERASDLGDSAKRLDRIREEIDKGVHTREIEPNEDGFTATHIPLGVPVRAGKTDSSDQDYYHFTTPPVHRDGIEVSIKNGSTTLVPAFRVLNAEKNDISGWQAAGSAGGNVRYSFFCEPESDYYVHVTSSWERTTGGYAIAVMAQEA